MPTGPTTENCYPTRRPTAPAPPCWEPTPNSGAPAGALLPGRSSSCPHPAAAPDRHGCRRQRRRRRTRPTLAVGIPASCRQRPAIPGRGEDPQGFTLAKHPRWARKTQKAPNPTDFGAFCVCSRPCGSCGSHARCMLLWLSSSVATLTFPGLRRLVAAWQRPVSWLDNVFFVVLWPAD